MSDDDFTVTGDEQDNCLDRAERAERTIVEVEQALTTYGVAITSPLADAILAVLHAHAEAGLYAEKLLRSSVASERMIGADLKQILQGE